MTREMTGSVLRMEKTSIHDGEGLRTVCFLKGCPLRCLWCSTPESQSQTPEKGYVLSKCKLCGRCIASCPQGALSLQGERVKTDMFLCNGCMSCVRTCPSAAHVSYGKLMTAENVLHEIAKDEIFFFHSGGGLTISGGEPLQQSRFVAEILKRVRANGIHTALETSLYAQWSELERLLPHLNLLYADLKHIDSERSREIIGVKNDLILENIARADKAQEQFEMIIRMPIIPGINDDDRDIERAGCFITGLGRVRQIELLGYHRLGTETYRNLELTYALPDLTPPSREYLHEKAALLARSSGKEILIGGAPLTS